MLKRLYFILLNLILSKDNSQEPKINNGDFSYNTAGIGGGAISGAGTIKLIDNTSFSYNIAGDKTLSGEETGDGYGGAIHSRGNIGTISNSIFLRNTAAGEIDAEERTYVGGYGGAIYLYEKEDKKEYGNIEKIYKTTFEENVAGFYGGAIYNGGTIYNISDSTFKANSVTLSGGAIYNSLTIGDITNTDFLSNTAGPFYFTNSEDGGAIYNKGEIGKISYGTFDSNVSYGMGGAIANIESSKIAKIDNTTFANNKSGMYGGAIYNKGKITDGIEKSEFNNNSLTAYGSHVKVLGTLVQWEEGEGESKETKSAYIIDKESELNGRSSYYAGGGAIHTSQNLVINETDFTNNSVTKKGTNYVGYVYTDSETKKELPKYVLGKSFAAGGAISTEYVLKTDNEGKIYKSSPILSITDSSFVGNSVSSTGEMAGGAIYVSGGVNQYFDEKTHEKSADIIGAGSLYITAQNKNVVFADNVLNTIDSNGNIISTQKNDIGLGYGAGVYLNANTGKSITFNGGISDDVRDGSINQYDGSAFDAKGTGKVEINSLNGYNGDIIFNERIDVGTLELYNGTLKSGTTNYTPDANGYVSSNIAPEYLLVRGGTLDLSNDYIEEMKLESLGFSNDADIIIDADLKTNAVDRIKTNSFAGNIDIKEINIINEPEGSTTVTPVFIVGHKAANYITTPTMFTSDNRYDSEAEIVGSDTVLKINKVASAGGLENFCAYDPNESVTDPEKFKTKNVSYKMTENEEVENDLSPFNSYVRDIVIRGDETKEVKDEKGATSKETIYHTITANGTKGFETSENQNITIKDVAKITGFKSENGGVLYNKGGIAELQRIAFDNNNASGNGGVINTTGDLSLTDTSFTNNTAGGKGGAIYAGNGANITINSSASDVKFSGNTANGKSDDIYLDSTKTAHSVVTLNAEADRKISLSSINGSKYGYKININQSAPNGGVVEIKNKVQNAVYDTGISLYGGTLKLSGDSALNSNILSLRGGTLDMQNNATGTMQLNQLNVSNSTNLKLDVDLKNATMDRIKADKYDIGAGAELKVTSLKALNDAIGVNTSIVFSGKDYGNEKLSNIMTNEVTKVTGPLYKYNVTADKKDGNYTFNFSNTNGVGDLEHNYSKWIGPVSAQLGGYANQLNIYQTAFGTMDSLMAMTTEQRKAYIEAKKCECQSDKKTYKKNANTSFFINAVPKESLYKSQREVGHSVTNGGIWFKPYGSFENVDLEGATKVNNFMYGGLVGGDCGLKDYGRGWMGTSNIFAGYMGSNQKFEDVRTYQNGATAGFSSIIFKNNFFGGLTANLGISGVDGSSDMGKENFGMFQTGAALKFGYNWNFKDSKYILQPHLLASYSFVNAFDYTNAMGVDVSSKPLHGVQLAPGLKLVGNFKNHWQPYVSVNYMWNMMDKANFTIGSVDLDSVSMKSYLEYGIGVQKPIGKIFTGYAQVMGRSLGRNGIAFALGGRWEIGN